MLDLRKNGERYSIVIERISFSLYETFVFQNKELIDFEIIFLEVIL